MSAAEDGLRDAVVALMYRVRWSERVGENDQFIQGGAAASLAYLEEHADTSRAVNLHWGDFSDAFDRLLDEHQAELEALEDRIQKDGALW